MRGASKTVVATLAAFLIVLGLAACGGGDDLSSTATEAASQGQSAGGASGGGGNGDAEGKSGAGGGQGKSAGSSGSKSDSGSAGDSGSGDFAPKPHKDSGGGSEQFKVKGGDNSVQEFGAEADTSELDEAATALHNFLDARAAGKWAAACTYIASSIIESLEQLATRAKQTEDASCAGILEKLTNPAAKQDLLDEAAQADVGSLRIEDEQAFVIYTGIGDTVLAMPMAQEDGVWKVASLAGTPLS